MELSELLLAPSPTNDIRERALLSRFFDPCAGHIANEGGSGESSESHNIQSSLQRIVIMSYVIQCIARERSQ